jgi:translation initiation factor IF-1
MKKLELKQLIKEVLNSSNTKTGVPAEVKVDDYVQWAELENERGMYVTKGTYIGKVIKVLGSKHIQVEVVFPLVNEGDTYKVTKDKIRRIPSVGEPFNFKSDFFGSPTLTGIITKVDIPNTKITIKTQEGKSITMSIRDRIWKINTRKF